MVQYNTLEGIMDDYILILFFRYVTSLLIKMKWPEYLSVTSGSLHVYPMHPRSEALNVLLEFLQDIGIHTYSKNSRKLKYGKCEKNHLNNRISKQQALSQWSNIA